MNLVNIRCINVAYNIMTHKITLHTRSYHNNYGPLVWVCIQGAWTKTWTGFWWCQYIHTTGTYVFYIWVRWHGSWYVQITFGIVILWLLPKTSICLSVSARSLSLSLNATYRHLSRSDSAQCAIRALSIEGEGSLARIAEHSTSNQHIQHTKCSTIGISGRVCDLSHTYTP